MARQTVGPREDHRPGNVGRAAPKFGANEIGDAAEKDANRRDERAEVEHRQRLRAIAPGEEEGSEECADEPTVKGHAAFPNFEDLDGVGEIILRIVEQYVAESSPANDAEGAIDQKIVDAFCGRPGRAAPVSVIRHYAPDQRPTEDEAGNIG